MVKLLVDTQEKDRFIEVDRYIKLTKGRWTVDSYEVTRLKTGDYVTFDWFVGFEYKGMDLMGSLFGGVLKQQLMELRAAVAHPYLMLKFNSIQEICDTFHSNPQVIIGILSSACAKSHVPYILGGDYWLPHMVRIIHKHYEGLKQGDSYVPIRPIMKLKTNATLHEWKIYMLKALPDIGDKTAEEAYEYFGHSFKTAVNASKEEWMQIKGISEKRATLITKVFS